MSDDFEKAKKALKKMNDTFEEIINFWNKFTKAICKKQPIDKDSLKKIKEKLKELEKQKLDFLNIFKLKTLYEKFNKINNMIIEIRAFAEYLDKKLPEEAKESIRLKLKTDLKIVELRKKMLETAFKKKFKTGEWAQPFETMNKYIEQTFNHKYIDKKNMKGKELSDIIKPLHKLKMSIIRALPYKIGIKNFAWWYGKLEKLDIEIRMLLEIYKNVRKPSDYKIFLDSLDRLFLVRAFLQELSEQIPK